MKRRVPARRPKPPPAGRQRRDLRGLPDAGLYRGQEGLFAWLADWGGSWDRWRAEKLELRTVGDRVIALSRSSR